MCARCVAKVLVSSTRQKASESESRRSEISAATRCSIGRLQPALARDQWKLDPPWLRRLRLSKSRETSCRLRTRDASSASGELVASTAQWRHRSPSFFHREVVRKARKVTLAGFAAREMWWCRCKGEGEGNAYQKACLKVEGRREGASGKRSVATALQLGRVLTVLD